MNKPAFEDTLPIESEKPSFEDTLPLESHKGMGSYALDQASDMLSQSPLGMAGQGMKNAMSIFNKATDVTSVPVPEAIQKGAQSFFRGARAAGVGGSYLLTGRNPSQNMSQAILRTREALKPEYEPSSMLEKIGSTVGENAPVVAASILSPNFGGPLAMEAQQAQSGRVSPLPSIVGAASKLTETVGPKIAKTVGEGMEKAGGKMATNMADVLPSTVGKLSKKFSPTGNPVEAGANIGQKLMKDGVLANNEETTWNNILNKKNEAGRAVDVAKKAIQEESSRYGGIEDPTVVDARPVLEPLQKEVNRLSSGDYAEMRVNSRPYKNALDALSKKAEANGGFLSLDDIQNQLDQVGEVYGGTPYGSPKYKTFGDLYGKLADARNEITEEIASHAQNPKLAENLRKANSDYHFYSSVFKDTNRGAMREGSGRGMGGGMTGHLSRLAALYALIKGKPGEALGLAIGGKVAPMIESELGSATAKDISSMGSSIRKTAPLLNKGPSAIMQSFAGSKVLDEKKALEYLDKAGNDPQKALELLRSDGY